MTGLVRVSKYNPSIYLFSKDIVCGDSVIAHAHRSHNIDVSPEDSLMNDRLHKLSPRSFFTLIIGALALSLLSVSGCSDDATENNSNISVAPDTGHADSTSDSTGDEGDGSDGSDLDTGNPDATLNPDVQPDGSSESDADADTTTPDVDPVPACPQTPCQGELICVDGLCKEDTPANKCAAAEDIGTLSPGAPLTINDTTAGASDILSNNCSGGVGSEKVYKFTVDQKSRISFEAGWPQQFDATVSFRFDGCEAPGEELCFDANSSLSANAGDTVILVVEQTVGRGNDFSLTLSATPESCSPGESSCNGDVLEVCGGNNNTLSYDCADSCNAGQCDGSVCANAIAVSASASFSGDLAAYPANLNFESNASCTVEGTPLPTPGPEVIFKLESLNAGQVVSVAAGSNRAMFFMTDCQAAPTCEAAMTGSGSAGTAEWTVPSGYTNQDVYLVIDRRTQSSGDFTYAIDISSP